MDLRQADHAQISQRAYEIFEARGRDHGHDLDDWLQAERELDGTQLPAERELNDVRLRTERELNGTQTIPIFLYGSRGWMRELAPERREAEARRAVKMLVLPRQPEAPMTD